MNGYTRIVEKSRAAFAAWAVGMITGAVIGMVIIIMCLHYSVNDPDRVQFRYVADDSSGDMLPVVLVFNNREFCLIERNPKDYDKEN